MRCPDCDTLMLKEYCDGGFVWRCCVCVQMRPLYDPRHAQMERNTIWYLRDTPQW